MCDGDWFLFLLGLFREKCSVFGLFGKKELFGLVRIRTVPDFGIISSSSKVLRRMLLEVSF